MAEMDTSSGGGHKKGPGVKKAKKLSTRIDMTPMVDLGFLLITFFMFTTTMSKPKTMEINMPAKDKVEDNQQTKIKASTALTLLLGNNHRVYYYEGLADDPANPPAVKVAYFKPGADGIRNVIIAKKQAVSQLQQSGGLGPKDNAVVLIKPDATSTYEDMVNALDEMAINDVKTYAVIDITDVDKEFMGAQ
ncbi:MAG: biopolymer transporter ExbD [Sphingobacteriales bacterium]|nr:MAG: biopolymer transporter ExbD [Sphingobacteriales bacterium]